MEIKVIDLNALPEMGGMVCRLEDGRELAVFRLRDGTITVLDNACPHQGGPLGEGEVDEDGFVSCPWHGWAFDCKSGICETMPGEDAKSYDVVIREQSVYIREEGGA